MGYGQLEGVAAIVRASSASDAPTTAYLYPVCNSANIMVEPKVVPRKPSGNPYPDQQIFTGYNPKFDIAEITPDPKLFTYIMALFWGAHSYLTNVITVTPALASQFLNVLVDRKYDLGSSTPTERLVGGKIEGLTWGFKENDYLTMKIDGPGCSVALAAALTMSIPVTAANAALNWTHLQETGAYINVGYNGVTAAAETDIKGISFTAKRTKTPVGIANGSKQPTDVRDGVFSLTAEITKEFASVAAKSAYLAAIAGQVIEITWKALVGGTSANYVEQKSIFGRIVGPVAGPIGSSEEPIMATIKVECFKNGAADLIGFASKEGSTAVYWA